MSSTSDDTSGDTTTSTTSEGTDTTGTDDSSGGSTTGEALPPCEAGCMVEFECGTEWKSAEACIEWCEANLVLAAEFSLFCQMAWSNLSACFGTLTCEEYAEYLEPTMFPYPCATESDSLAFECKGQ